MRYTSEPWLAANYTKYIEKEIYNLGLQSFQDKHIKQLFYDIDK